MKKFNPLLLLLITLGIITSSPGYSQVHCHLLQASNAARAWFAALILTWGLSGLGFYSIYKSSKGA